VASLSPAQGAALSNSSIVVRVRGVGGKLDDKRVIKCLGLQSEPTQIDIVTLPNGSQSGEAFVTVFSENAAMIAMKMHNTRTTGNVLEIYKSCPKEKEMCLKGMREASNFSEEGVAEGQDFFSRFSVWISGLARSTTEIEVANFLCGLNIHPQGIHFVQTANLRKTCEALVELRYEVDVQIALGRSGRKIAGRVIHVYRASPDDIRSIVDIESSVDVPADGSIFDAVPKFRGVWSAVTKVTDVVEHKMDEEGSFVFIPSPSDAQLVYVDDTSSMDHM